MGILRINNIAAIPAMPADQKLLSGKERSFKMSVRSKLLCSGNILRSNPFFTKHLPLISTYARSVSSLAIKVLDSTPNLTGLLMEHGMRAFNMIGLTIITNGSRKYILRKGENLDELTNSSPLTIRSPSIPLEDVVLLFSRSPVHMEHIGIDGQRRLLETAAEELGKQAGALERSDLLSKFKAFNYKSLQVLYYYYTRKFPNRPMEAMFEKLCIAEIIDYSSIKYYSFEEALELFRYPYAVEPGFWGRIKPEDQRKFVEMAADELGKSVWMLSSHDFKTSLSVFNGKSLESLLIYYQPRKFEGKTVVQTLLQNLGVPDLRSVLEDLRRNRPIKKHRYYDADEVAVIAPQRFKVIGIRLVQHDKNASLTEEQKEKIISAVYGGNVAARDALVLCYQNLIFWVINKWFLHGNFVSYKDMVSTGNFALIAAAENYNAALKCNFTTYATTTIYNNILSALIREKRQKALRLEDFGYGQHQEYSQDDDTPGKHERPFMNIPDERIGIDFIGDLISANVIEQVRNVLGQLSPRDRHIIQQGFGFNGKEMTSIEIGLELNLSGERIHNILTKIYHRIRRSELKKALI